MHRVPKRKKIKAGGNEIVIGGTSVIYHPKRRKIFQSLTAPKGNVPVGKYSKVYPSIRQYFPETKKHIKYTVAGVEDEGNCFYDTLSASMNVDDWHSASLSTRKNIGLNLRKVLHSSVTKATWESFWESQSVKTKEVPTYQEIKKQMKNPKTWADVYSILYVAEMLEINLLVFDTSTGRLYCGTSQQKPGYSTVFIAWIDHAHFSPLMEVNVNTMEIKLRFTPHDRILKHVLSLYKKEGCPRVTIHDILLRRRRGGGKKMK